MKVSSQTSKDSDSDQGIEPKNPKIKKTNIKQRFVHLSYSSSILCMFPIFYKFFHFLARKDAKACSLYVMINLKI